MLSSKINIEKQPTSATIFEETEPKSDNECTSDINEIECTSNTKENECTSDTATDCEDEDLDDLDDLDDSEVPTDLSHKAPASYLEAHQIQEKWELRYLFAFYSAAQKGWLCQMCSEYGKGDDYCRNVGAKLHEHPTDTFECHIKSKKDQDSKKKKQEIKNLLSKGSIYQQIFQGEQYHSQNTKKRNRCVINKFIQTTYFVAQKKWAVRENFSDVIDFLRNLGD